MKARSARGSSGFGGGWPLPAPNPCCPALGPTSLPSSPCLVGGLTLSFGSEGLSLPPLPPSQLLTTLHCQSEAHPGLACLGSPGWSLGDVSTGPVTLESLSDCGISDLTPLSPTF